MQAGGDGRDRRLGGDGLGVPGDRHAARRRGRAPMGTRARARLFLAAGEGSVSTAPVALESIDLTTTTVRELNQRLHEAGGAGRTHWRIENPEGAHALVAGL